VVRILTATQAKAHLLALLGQVADGEEVVITRHGRAIARLVPATGPHALKGKLAGVAKTMTADDMQLFGTDAAWDFD
jgi:prevent-host-death family protein